MVREQVINGIHTRYLPTRKFPTRKSGIFYQTVREKNGKTVVSTFPSYFFPMPHVVTSKVTAKFIVKMKLVAS